MFLLNEIRRRRRRHAPEDAVPEIERPRVRIVSLPLLPRISVAAGLTNTPRRRQSNLPPLETTNNKNNNIDESQPSMPLLYSLARSWAWEAVTFRCQTHPEEASAEHRDYMGDTCLHWAVFGRPPLRTVQALLAACPETAQTANHRGLYSLHVATSYRASGDVIEAVLQAYPAAAAIPSDSGACPLHILCDYGGSLEAMKALLKTREGMVSVMMKDRLFQRRPLYILNARKNLHLECTQKSIVRNRRLEQRSIRRELEQLPVQQEDWKAKAWMRHELIERLEDDIRPMQRTEFWQKASLLVVAEYQHILAAQSTDEDEQPSLPSCILERDEASEEADTTEAQSTILHACVGNPECPPALQEYVILLYEPLLLIPDNRGRLPLHLAAANYSVNCSEASSQLLLELLEACPAAASVRDDNGCLPLSLASRRKSMRDEDNVNARNPLWTEGLGALIDAYPLALLENDIGLLQGNDHQIGMGDDDFANSRSIYANVFARLSQNSLFAIIQASPAILTCSMR